eukprot:15448569-Alexandrium_andersonii.AAC.1
MCPVHALSRWFAGQEHGAQPFARLRPAGVTRELRRRLQRVEVQRHALYTLHSFRRGRARELQRAGGHLWQILDAGGWRSSAFLRYLDLEEVEAQAELEAHIADSESELDVD